MKKIFAITLAFLLIQSDVGCGTRSKSDDSESTASPEEIAELQEDFAALAEDIADLTEEKDAITANAAQEKADLESTENNVGQSTGTNKSADSTASD